jgi:hypothetical protein
MLMQIEILELYEEGKLMLKLENITGQHSLSLQSITIMEYLIKWNNMLPKEATWENEQFMKK